MKRLLKRRYVQESLESAEKEMGGKSLTLEELDKLLTEQGVNTNGKDAAFRIAADSATRLIYISGMYARSIKIIIFLYIFKYIHIYNIIYYNIIYIIAHRQEHIGKKL